MGLARECAASRDWTGLYIVLESVFIMSELHSDGAVIFYETAFMAFSSVVIGM